MTVPAAVVADRYRDLSAEERRAFVADLRSARGWETTIDGPVVEAIRSNERRRIAVGEPPSNVDVDAVVAVDEWDARTAARDRNLQLIDATDLRNELFYGLDPDVGEQLYRKHFGVSPECRPPASLPERTSSDSSTTPTDRTRPANRDAPVDGRADGDTETRSEEKEKTVRGNLDDSSVRVLVAVLLVALVVAVPFASGMVNVDTTTDRIGETFGVGDSTEPRNGMASNPERHDATTEPDGPDVSDAEPGTGGSEEATTDDDPADGIEEDGPIDQIEDDPPDGIEGTPGPTAGPPAGFFFIGVHDVDRAATGHAEAIGTRDSFSFTV